MANLMITPSKLSGEVKIPPSKSMAHRAIICAALSDGLSIIENIDYSDDIIATIEGMKVLGASIVKYDDYLEIVGIYKSNKENNEFRIINCNESGSTLRFLVPISMLFSGKSKFVGKGNLGKRPLTTYYNIFENQGIEYSCEEGNLNLIINGKLKPGNFEVEGNVSSQFITGLLFTLPLLNSDSKITITTKMESKGYIDLTLQVLKLYGIEIVNHEYKQFIVRGRQEYKARDYRVESDFSQAAFYLVAGALGNDVTLLDLNLDSLQGDKATIDFLKQINCEIVENDEGIKVVSHGLKATIVDASQCPDVIPVVSLALAVASGHSEVINAGRLRIKECDRLQATVEELNKLKAHAVEHESSMELDGVETLTGGNVSSHDDHRMAMMLAIASTVCKEPVIIDNKECVKKSYPSFWEDFEMLGGKIDGGNL